MAVVNLDHKENERAWEVSRPYGDTSLALAHENKMSFSPATFIFGKASNVLIDCGESSISHILSCSLCSKTPEASMIFRERSANDQSINIMQHHLYLNN